MCTHFSGRMHSMHKYFLWLSASIHIDTSLEIEINNNCDSGGRVVKLSRLMVQICWTSVCCCVFGHNTEPKIATMAMDGIRSL